MYILVSIKKSLIIIVFFAFILVSLSYAPNMLFPVKYKNYVVKYAKQNEIDPYLVFAVVKAESGFDEFATSRKGAKGLMQLMDKTAEWGANEVGITNFNSQMLYEPDINIRIGCWYLKRLITEFEGNVNMALLAYNGGSGKVRKWLEGTSTEELMENVPYQETDNFVRKVNEFYELYMRYYKGG